MEDHDLGPISWDEARGLARRFGAIGAHILRHAILICKTEASTLSDVEENIYAHHLCNKDLALPLPLAQKGASRRDLAIAVAEALFRYDIFGLAPRSLCGL